MKKIETKSLISTKSLSKSFKNQIVLDNLTNDFNEGERISLSGPNGAGKTTLIRCILGQYTFDGRLDVLGLDPRKEHEVIMKEIG